MPMSIGRLPRGALLAMSFSFGLLARIYTALPEFSNALFRTP
jgi:hypothetical protein